MTGQQAAAAERTDQGCATTYVTFRLSDEDFALEILRVQELRGWEPVTRVPGAPPHVRGLVNVRGAIVPVMDLRPCLSMGLRPYGKKTVVIVVQTLAQGVAKRVGLIVDAATGVLDAGSYRLGKAVLLDHRAEHRLFSGLAMSGDRTYLLLDVDRLHPDAVPALRVDSPQRHGGSSSNEGDSGFEKQ